MWLLLVLVVAVSAKSVKCSPDSDDKQCGANESYVQCAVGCPNNYCPKDENTDSIVCDPPRNCPPGCVCKVGYRWKSEEDKTCIPAEECPPVECTRPNEDWHPCPSACVTDSCEDFKCQPDTCNTFVKNCQPKCACATGYCRNNEGVCVTAPSCPMNDSA